MNRSAGWGRIVALGVGPAVAINRRVPTPRVSFGGAGMGRSFGFAPLELGLQTSLISSSIGTGCGGALQPLYSRLLAVGLVTNIQ
jgi:hypothetical protein